MALLANTLATGAALVALILAFGPISGAHFNPVRLPGFVRWTRPDFIAVQLAGGAAATVLLRWLLPPGLRRA